MPRLWNWGEGQAATGFSAHFLFIQFVQSGGRIQVDRIFCLGTTRGHWLCRTWGGKGVEQIFSERESENEAYDSSFNLSIQMKISACRAQNAASLFSPSGLVTFFFSKAQFQKQFPHTELHSTAAFSRNPIGHQLLPSCQEFEALLPVCAHAQRINNKKLFWPPHSRAAISDWSTQGWVHSEMG